MTKKNIDKVVLYHAKWCGHCIRFQDSWKKLKEDLKELNIETDEYEETQYQDRMKKENILGYPTIRFYKSSGEHKDYEGARENKLIIKEATEYFNLSNKKQIGGKKKAYIIEHNKYNEDEDEDTYQAKYVKYKKKYIELKNKMNL
jgi:thiol-disulfide isomerase/thioredoxin